MRSVTIIALLLALSVASAFNLRSLTNLTSALGLKKNGNIPVVLIHGIGDSCSNGGMQHLVNLFADQLNTYVTCIESGSDIMSWFSSMESQSEKACENVKKDRNLDGDFAVVGISQGSLIGRAIMQKCAMKGTVKRYISIGGPHMGVAGIPNCPLGSFPCNIVDWFVDLAYYWEISQQLVGPAGYYKDPKNFDRYAKYSNYLADLNNEKPTKNQSYVDKWKKMDKVLFVKFDADLMIQPKETAQFEFLNSTGQLVPLEQSDFYKNDYLGIRYLDENKKIERLTLKGGHLHFSDSDVINYFVPILKS